MKLAKAIKKIKSAIYNKRWQEVEDLMELHPNLIWKISSSQRMCYFGRKINRSSKQCLHE